jgi:hypothetical protein
MGSSASATAAADLPLEHEKPIPWLVWVSTFASTAVVAASHWDFSWHRSIGRDTFFSPPHCLLYLGALLACGSSGYAILRSTLSAAHAPKETSVTVWGFRGPFGAFVSAWGGIAMLASGPFDNWWHEAYGLDIVIQSPPHMVLFSGMLAIVSGALLLAIAHANRMRPASGSALAIVVFGGGVALTVALGGVFEDTLNYQMHGAKFYWVVALVVPGILAAIGRTSGHRHGATGVAAVYTSFILAMIGILPLFPAEPRLGPVLQPITSFVPPPFPLLVLPAAVIFDLVRSRFETRSLWLQSLLGGSLFLVTFAALQWPFANFLQSRWADNRFFVGREFAYFQADSSAAVRRIFWPTEASPEEFWGRLVLALAIAVLTVRAGLAAGGWLRELRR